MCDRLDLRATEIYMGCLFQDITGQRIEKVVGVLRLLENCVAAMIKIWGIENISTYLDQTRQERGEAHLLIGPPLDGERESAAAIAALDASEPENADNPAANPQPPGESAALKAPTPENVGEPSARTDKQPAERSIAGLDSNQISALFS